MKTIAEKITELGGELAPPASANVVAQLEARLGLPLPTGLSGFLRNHNGSTKETDDSMWRFWPCAEITSFQAYHGENNFTPDNNDLRALDPSASSVTLPGRNLILFSDSLIGAPPYGVFHLPGHRWDGTVFDISNGYLSAASWIEWVAAFIERAEDHSMHSPFH
mgnify:CR=1 FL=1